MTTLPAPDAPLPVRFKAWLDERFPFANAPAFFLFYLTAAMVADHDRGGQPDLGWSDVVSCVVVWSLFLLLRVFDEHKDYDDDMIHHRERVLQRGLISLGHLKIVGGVCFALTLGWTLARSFAPGFAPEGGGSSVGPLLAWAVMVVWAGLMAAEFFCSAWLKPRLVLYALSHMAIMPLVAWWCMNLSVPGAGFTANAALLGLLFFLTGLAFEIGRKTRGPEEERDGVDSYSKILGTRGSAWTLFGVTLLIVAVIVALALRLQTSVGAETGAGVSWWPLAPLALAAPATLAVILSFIRAPSLKGRKRNEAALGLLALFAYGAVIAAALIQTGAAWR